ncbi:WD40-repeat-containing domain protein [Myxozyma melibiosi]|uniref:Pre-rRNA-processing protein IPI3 n=1 Tax=Myxozyma melibiosi TaxID=54550 RepID=A0ABR1F1F5_9ASCO
MADSMIDEYLIYCTASSGPKDDGTISVGKFNSGLSTVKTFKQSGSFSNRVVVNESVVLAAQAKKAIINVYSYAKDGPVQKLFVPDKLSCLAATHSGKFLVAGTASGKLIVWDLTSGVCLLYKEVHYGEISCLVFSHDDGMLFSGGHDSRILGWRLIDLVRAQSRYEELQPVCSSNQHKLPITGLACGYGSSLEARLYSTAADGTCMVWNASDLRLYTTYVFNGTGTCLALDPAERAIYVGTDSGSIIHIDLYRSSNDGTGLEYNGGLQRVVNVESDAYARFDSHSAKVLSLDLSFDATQLVSGGEDGVVLLWDISSHQIMKKLGPAKTPVFYVKIQQSLPATKYFQLESLKFSFDQQFERNHNSWSLPTPFSAPNVSITQLVNQPSGPDHEQFIKTQPNAIVPPGFTGSLKPSSQRKPTQTKSDTDKNTPTTPSTTDESTQLPSSEQDKKEIEELKAKLQTMTGAYNQLWAKFSEKSSK